MTKLSKFGAAFKAARASGKKEFEFGGKKYNTKVKGEGESPKKVPTPSAAPRATSGAARSTEGKVSAKSGASRSTQGKTTLSDRAKKRGQQGPSPAKAVGVAKAGSAISKASAKAENAPVKKEAQGPVAPRAVGIAKKGSAISKAVARRENKPVKKK